MTDRERLKQIIIELSYEKRKVILASGRESDFYFDGKQTTLHAEGGLLVGKLFYEAIKDVEGVQGVGGITLGADPIATATSIAAYLDGRPMHAFIIRKEPKGHGTGQWLEGRKNLPPGSRVVIVEDVVTTGGSSMKAVRRAEEEGLVVLGIVALVDREEGGRENIEAEGVWLRSIFTKSQLVA
ncbi:orotate phosphoribosyltransferase [Geobacter hydrogenophilus]|uniref:Orotate phosphoribosyltransferase n=1 Tax=Geobacter hydrogenophilus TaxID=40983 RepID=A0A9W6FXB1_9BACT|nr:orotate phosphoribosyltransferase [Geobacter hydrogenophilus]MBT0895253.1 orotate phosphoribosyltransferase [Geobacter hydrogenophilus]GLI36565.1 orotate phosphoribosyltransferase [Geobacter hydrogenophilus]